MKHPLKAIPRAKRRPVFLVLLAATLAVMLAMNWIGKRLITPQAPAGIISYELAGSLPAARAILDSWDAAARQSAAFSLGLDYLFMALYSTTIGLACVWAGDVMGDRRWRLAGLGVPLAWGQWLAAAFDAVENLALAAILSGALFSPWPGIARICATVKFGLIAVGLAYALLGLAASVFRTKI